MVVSETATRGMECFPAYISLGVVKGILPEYSRQGVPQTFDAVPHLVRVVQCKPHCSVDRVKEKVAICNRSVTETAVSGFQHDTVSSQGRERSRRGACKEIAARECAKNMTQKLVCLVSKLCRGIGAVCRKPIVETSLVGVVQCEVSLVWV